MANKMTEETALRKVKQIVRGSVDEQTEGQFDEYTVEIIYGKENINKMLLELQEVIENIYKDKK